MFLQDAWELVDFYAKWKSGVLGVSDFWALHNEHRILSPRLILGADLLLESGRGYLVIALLFVLQFVHVGLLYRALKREPRFDAAMRVYLLGIALFFMFWLRQRENFIWTFQIAWVLNGLMASLAAYWVAGVDATTASLRGRNAPRLLAAALASFVAATSLASGLTIPLILSIVLWKIRVNRTVVVLWTLFAISLVVAYLAGYESPAHHPKPTDAYNLDTVLYLLAYLGNPIAINGVPIGAAFLPGLLTMGLYLWLTARFLRASTTSFFDRFGFTVSTQVLLMAMMTAVGRHSFGLHQAAAGRYSTPVLFLWFVLAAWGMATLAYRPYWRKWVVRALTIFVVGLVLPLQVIYIPRTLKMYRVYDEASLALMAGVEDTAATNRAYPFTERLWGLNESARGDGLSFYGPEWTRWPRFGVALPSFDTAIGMRMVLVDQRPVGTLARPGFYVSGMVTTESGQAVKSFADFVLMRGDSIVGYARSRMRGCEGCYSGYVGGASDFELVAVKRNTSGGWKATLIP